MTDPRTKKRALDAPLPSGKEVRALRTALGWTQHQLGEVIGVRWIQVWRWEHGQTHMSPLSRRAFRTLGNQPAVKAAVAEAIARQEAEETTAA